MAISVVCKKCQTRFNVSDKFAGQTGPCPKCKNPITIPKSNAAVTIHEPAKPATSSQSGQMPTAPIVFEENPVSPVVITLVISGLFMSLLAAFAAGRLFQSPEGTVAVPTWLLAVSAVAVALPTTRIGYAMFRDKELEAYSGRSLFLRLLICSVVYAGLWWLRSFLGTELELWQWTFVIPFFLFTGGLAAVTSLDLEWETGVGHYALYVFVTALMRYLAGFPAL
jgi:uncharacterized protein (DUF486 family)